MSQIALRYAQLCLDCETIGDSPNGCTACGSKSLHPVASFINRPNQPEDSRITHTCVDQPSLPCPACSL